MPKSLLSLIQDLNHVVRSSPQGLVSLGGIWDSLKKLLSAILAAISRFFGSLFQAELSIVENLHQIHDDFLELEKNVKKQIAELKEHKFDPKWRSRVISVPKAIETIKGLIEYVHGDWRQRLKTLETPIHDLSLIFKAEDLTKETPQEQGTSGLARSAVKVDELAHMIQDVQKAMKVIKDFDDFFQKLIDLILKMEGLFLPQNNKQAYVGVKFKFHQRVRPGTKRPRPEPPKPPLFEADQRGTQARVAQLIGQIEEQRQMIADLEAQL